VLLLAIIAGAIAAGLIVAFLASQDSGGSSGADAVATRNVVVAREEIPAGVEVEASMVELRALPATAIISTAATSLDQVVGVTTRYPLSPGEQFSDARLVQSQEVKALSFQIPEGKRGFTIPVAANNTPASVIVPGDFVDVLVAAPVEDLLPGTQTFVDTTTDTSEGGTEAVVTLLQNVQVLSVQRNYVDNGVVYDESVRGELPDEGDNVSYVTLALDPEQTQLLWLASQNGAITLALRAFGDDSITPLTPVTEPVAE
jgi:pilus assembly protein CpaB